ncbi:MULTISPECIES: helix-turn-helix domain-containing protein [Bacillus]|uniref:helix-turn-helix domain-containing protein n=1 Tax=Bacillus TaxID=1386 RepID=UPI000BF37A82|nr:MULTISPECIES: helix-turn-helix domain-containing protein [Bacillus]MCU5744934.1 helix-turn-helix domain-containing protein [Bacillus cereus]MCU9578569.1 helix-turn-helix domain-containing protein [Bacillus cereus]PFL43541.1 transcriptional regulator [Bacillus cereus]PGQ66425.1 transcriptional regulator [Bacillus cereus]
MNWEEYEKSITALDKSEMEQINLISQLVNRRIELGLTQTELAKRSGLKQSAIARMESIEGAIPRLDTLEKVIRALGMKIMLVEDENAATLSSPLYAMV